MALLLVQVFIPVRQALGCAGPHGYNTLSIVLQEKQSESRQQFYDLWNNTTNAGYILVDHFARSKIYLWNFIVTLNIFLL